MNITLKCDGKQITLCSDHEANVAAMMAFGLTDENADGLLSAIRVGDLDHVRECGFTVENTLPVSASEIVAAAHRRSLR